MSIHLEPTLLPVMDILSMAQSGTIVRAERQTPENGIPVFLTHQGWNELVARHSKGESLPALAARLLPALERIIARLLEKAALHYQHEQKQSHLATTHFTLESDLFTSDKETWLIFVRDKTHPVACALLGTPEQLRHLPGCQA